jgi:hypothetical protein
MNKRFYTIFHICLFILILQSLYILVSNLKTKKYSLINSWQFPMLLAIFIESMIINL